MNTNKPRLEKKAKIDLVPLEDFSNEYEWFEEKTKAIHAFFDLLSDVESQVYEANLRGIGLIGLALVRDARSRRLGHE